MKGFAATRLDDVAERAGVAKGTIYLYFKDKQQLFRAVVRSLIRKRIPFLIADAKGSAPELLRGLLARMYTNIVRDDKVRAIVRMLIAESGNFPQLADIYHREIIVPGLRTVRAVIKRGIGSGHFRRTEAVRFPQILVGPAVLAAIWKLVHGDRYRLDVDDYMHAHLQLLMFALRPEGRRNAPQQVERKR
jgi:AcrR family transcriptional regulator